MATIVAFSARSGDCIAVEGNLQEVNDQLAAGRRTGSGLCQLNRVPGNVPGPHFDPTPVMVNPEKVAYLWEEMD